MPETLVSDLQQVRSRSQILALGQDDAGAVKGLDRVDQRGPVALLQQIRANFHYVIRTKPQEIAVECRMVEGA